MRYAQEYHHQNRGSNKANSYPDTNGLGDSEAHGEEKEETKR
jgi:hypothetical protein